MLNSIIVSGAMTVQSVAICTFAALFLGLIIACIYMKSGTYTKSFVTTLIILPALIEIVIMMVNGNLGTGVAVLGAFSLVRFRSVPGNSRDITSIFFAMSVGLSVGMGYVTFAAMVTAVIGLALYVISKSKLGETKNSEKELRITIPENLDYTNIFDDIFEKYTKKLELNRVKTTNLGSMYELRYSVELKDSTKEKDFIDEIRCRNGNLTVLCGRIINNKEEL